MIFAWQPLYWLYKQMGSCKVHSRCAIYPKYCGTRTDWLRTTMLLNGVVETNKWRGSGVLYLLDLPTSGHPGTIRVVQFPPRMNENWFLDWTSIPQNDDGCRGQWPPPTLCTQVISSRPLFFLRKPSLFEPFGICLLRLPFLSDLSEWSMEA